MRATRGIPLKPSCPVRPENCGKCHLGPDHPQIEIYNESKHGIAFYANRDKMALDKGSWVLGKNYSAAPTCASCHISSYMTTNGVATANNHDVGERISWTLRPVISTKLNLVIYTDGYREDYPETKPLPKVGAEVTTTENVVENEKMAGKPVKRTVAKIVTWQERRNAMKGVCLNCHGNEYVDNFYQQFDSLVALVQRQVCQARAKDDGRADGGRRVESEGALRTRGAMGFLGTVAPRRPPRPPRRLHDGAGLHPLARHV